MQGIPYDTRMAMMEFQLRNFQVKYEFLHIHVCTCTCTCDIKFNVGVLDLNGGYKGHPDLWAESLHTQSIGVQAS